MLSERATTVPINTDLWFCHSCGTKPQSVKTSSDGELTCGGCGENGFVEVVSPRLQFAFSSTVEEQVSSPDANSLSTNVAAGSSSDSSCVVDGVDRTSHASEQLPARCQGTTSSQTDWNSTSTPVPAASATSQGSNVSAIQGTTEGVAHTVLLPSPGNISASPSSTSPHTFTNPFLLGTGFGNNNTQSSWSATSIPADFFHFMEPHFHQHHGGAMQQEGGFHVAFDGSGDVRLNPMTVTRTEAMRGPARTISTRTVGPNMSTTENENNLTAGFQQTQAQRNDPHAVGILAFPFPMMGGMGIGDTQTNPEIGGDLENMLQNTFNSIMNLTGSSSPPPSATEGGGVMSNNQNMTFTTTFNTDLGQLMS